MSDSVNPYAPSTLQNELHAPQNVTFEGLKGTETGLRITYYGIVLVLLCLISAVPLAFIFQPGILAVAFVILVGWLMLVVGPFFCLTAPPETNAKGLIVGSIVCQCIAIVFSIASNFINGAAIPILSMIGSLLGIAGSVLFVLFMMKIAQFVGRQDLHGQGRRVLIGAVVLVCISLLAVVGAVLAGPMLGILMLGVAIGGLVLFVMYANLINSLQKAIAMRRKQLSNT